MVGEYIRSLRASAGLNQRELAEGVGISASMLSLIESGKREPTIRLLKDIGRVLGIPAAALFVVALYDNSTDMDDPELNEKFRAMSDHLLSAVQHSIVLRRLQGIREHN